MHPLLDVRQVNKIYIEYFISFRGTTTQDGSRATVSNVASNPEILICMLIIIGDLEEVLVLTILDTVIFTQLFVALHAAEPKHKSIVELAACWHTDF